MTGEDERRYDEAEIDEIFSRAAEASAGAEPGSAPARASHRDGLTLSELQGIGAEVGLAPERVAAAAAAIDVAGSAERVSAYGHPTSVSRTLEVARAPTDREWERLVATLREEIGAGGRVESRGEAREWTDGAFHLYVEPSGAGTRLRMTERRAEPAWLAGVGALTFFYGVVLLVTSGLDAATFGPLLEWLLPLITAAIGGAAVGTSLVQARRWALDREARMERIAATANELLAEGDAG